MPFSAFFDAPEAYSDRYCHYRQGGSPQLLHELTSILEKDPDDVQEIIVCWYLYNNNYLHKCLERLSKKGIKVTIITIPLEGYDSRNPKKLIDLDDGNRCSQQVSKYDLARSIFREAYNGQTNENLNIYFFPHVYVRSIYVKPFARGTLPYSLHIKSAYIKRRAGYSLILSSSNMAVRDLVKHESMVCIENEKGYEDVFSRFYKDLIRNSINIKDYKSEYNTTRNRYDKIQWTPTNRSFITAPFYDKSSNVLEEELCSLIDSAQNRIIVCAQHLAAFNYNDRRQNHAETESIENREGLLGRIIAAGRKGVHTVFFSQTFSPDDQTDFPVKFRQPANNANFQNFYRELKHIENTHYYVNESIHSKFIIIDKKLVYCTYNFTPTQFIYLDNVNIASFVNMPEMSYEGIHCEVAAHVIIEDEKIVECFLSNMRKVAKLNSTHKVL